MKKILSLDISSTTIGWASFEVDDNNAELKSHGHIKPLDKKKANGSLILRLNDAIKKIESLITATSPDEVVIEDYAKRFSKGRSTANTIILLAVFNELIGLTIFNKINKDSIRYAVISIRSEVSKVFNEKVVSKDELFPAVVKHCNNFKLTTNKKGSNKKECEDEADAIACGICHISRKHKFKNWKL